MKKHTSLHGHHRGFDPIAKPGSNNYAAVDKGSQETILHLPTHKSPRQKES